MLPIHVHHSMCRVAVALAQSCLLWPQVNLTTQVDDTSLLPDSPACTCTHAHLVRQRVHQPLGRPQGPTVGSILSRGTPGLETRPIFRCDQQHGAAPRHARHCRVPVTQADVKVHEGGLLGHLLQAQPIPASLRCAARMSGLPGRGSRTDITLQSVFGEQLGFAGGLVALLGLGSTPWERTQGAHQQGVTSRGLHPGFAPGVAH